MSSSGEFYPHYSTDLVSHSVAASLSGHFDGRTTFEEIQYRTEIKRARFRNLIIEYDTWVGILYLVLLGLSS